MRVESLIDLHHNPEVNRIAEFAEVAGNLASDVGTLAHHEGLLEPEKGGWER